MALINSRKRYCHIQACPSVPGHDGTNFAPCTSPHALHYTTPHNIMPQSAKLHKPFARMGRKPCRLAHTQSASSGMAIDEHCRIIHPARMVNGCQQCCQTASSADSQVLLARSGQGLKGRHARGRCSHMSLCCNMDCGYQLALTAGPSSAPTSARLLWTGNVNKMQVKTQRPAAAQVLLTHSE